jgi:16S rRNA (cytosine967-C5)-methyltransferase
MVPQESTSVLPPVAGRADRLYRLLGIAAATLRSAEGLLMTPRRTGTDGFFVSILKRNTPS